MKPYEKPLSPQEYLMHYGVKGMKWGVRRYQNYDGSYTRKGLERYRKAESDYETAKSKADETRAAYKSGQATRQQVKDAKSAVKTEKRKMENAYEKLKTDKLADEGKKLYQSGKTISGNTQATYLAEGVIIAGSTVVSRLLANQLNNQEVAQYCRIDHRDRRNDCQWFTGGKDEQGEQTAESVLRPLSEGGKVWVLTTNLFLPKNT